MVTKTEVEKNVNAWLEAIESGTLKQTTGALETDKGFCCLGVGCKVVGAKRKKTEYVYHIRYAYDGTETEVLPDTVRIKLGLKEKNPTVKNVYVEDNSGDIEHVVGVQLSELNDHWSLDFNTIADIIRAQPKGMFRYKDLKLNPKTNGIPSKVVTKEEYDRFLSLNQ